MLSDTPRWLFSVSEQYPDLKANEHVMDLQEQITSTGDRISFAGQDYNDFVFQLHETREKIFYNFILPRGNFPEREYFEIDVPSEREAPEVDFIAAVSQQPL